jgi:phosphomannomutase/phosphoglucomutase
MTRLFGTNGIRWLVGNRSPDYAVRLGATAGEFYGNGRNVAIGIDTRTSSPMLFNAIVSGLVSTGCNATYLGVVPTPLVQFAVKHLKFDGGLMVTASHNPPEFNGMKFFASDGTELSRPQEERFEELCLSESRKMADWNSIGICRTEATIQSVYKDAITSFMKLDNRNVQAFVDCANGAAIGYTPDILINAGCKVLTLNAQPDGRFPGRMPEPVKENVGALMSAVKCQGADIGIAHDGDADRATFVDEKGNYITGDQSLAILAIDALERKGKGTIVVPINTSKVVQDVTESRGGKIEYTPIGSPFIARRMMENGAVFGGEGNGGAIFPEHQFCRDGMMAAARMVEIASRRVPLSQIVAELPIYYLRNEKLKILPELKNQILEMVRKESEGQIIELDGIKAIGKDCWTLVRASGTEPIIRITAEALSEGHCNKLLSEKVKSVKDIIKDLS